MKVCISSSISQRIAPVVRTRSQFAPSLQAIHESSFHAGSFGHICLARTQHPSQLCHRFLRSAVRYPFLHHPAVQFCFTSLLFCAPDGLLEEIRSRRDVADQKKERSGESRIRMLREIALRRFLQKFESLRSRRQCRLEGSDTRSILYRGTRPLQRIYNRVREAVLLREMIIGD